MNELAQSLNCFVHHQLTHFIFKLLKVLCSMGTVQVLRFSFGAFPEPRLPSPSVIRVLYFAIPPPLLSQYHSVSFPLLTK